MKRLAAILILLLLPCELWATSITSTTSGNWATGGTWVGGVAPGDGDTAIIANGHTVTIAAGTSVTVGDSANPTTPAISSNNSNGTGILVVGDGATLTVKGNVRQGNANWTIGKDCTINFNHASANLSWQITDDGGTGTNALLIINGTSGHRTTIQKSGSANGGGFGNISTRWSLGGKIQASFVQFTDIGTTTLPLLDFRGGSSSYTGTFDDCLFTRCGAIASSHNVAAGATFRLRRCSWNGTPAYTNGRIVELFLAAGTQSGILFDNIAWKGQIFVGGATSGVVGVTWSGECIGEGVGNTICPLDATDNPHSATVSAMLLHRIAASSGIPSRIMAGTITKLFLMGENEGTAGNAHNAQITPIAATTITNGVWEFGTGNSTANDATGDQLQVVGNPGSATTLTISNIISPPLGGEAAGSLVNVSANAANLRLTIKHCTSHCSENGDSGGSFKSENCTGGAGMVQAIKDNIFVGVDTHQHWITYTQGATALADGSLVGCDYNNKYNFSGDGYQQADAKFSTPSPPGTHDTTYNPSFVDNTRNLLKWGQSIDGTITTYQQVVDKLLARNNDSGYNSSFTLAAYWTYMQGGFAPTNSSLRNAGSDGVTLGAVEGQFAKPTIWYYLNASNALERAILAQTNNPLSILTER